MPRASSTSHKAIVTLMMFFLLKHFSTLTLFESHDATSHTPMTSTKLPIVACVIVSKEKRVNKLWRRPSMLSREGIMMANIETVCRAMPLLIIVA